MNAILDPGCVGVTENSNFVIGIAGSGVATYSVSSNGECQQRRHIQKP